MAESAKVTGLDVSELLDSTPDEARVYLAAQEVLFADPTDAKVTGLDISVMWFKRRHPKQIHLGA